MTLDEKIAQTLHPWETATPAKVYEQFNATGLGAWYLTMTTLPPHARGDLSATPVEALEANDGTDGVPSVDQTFGSNAPEPESPQSGTSSPPPPPPPPPSADTLALVRARNTIQKDFVTKTRLGIPVSFIMETLHSGTCDGTIFPMPINYGR
jgi:hypothetical protein